MCGPSLDPPGAFQTLHMHAIPARESHAHPAAARETTPRSQFTVWCANRKETTSKAPRLKARKCTREFLELEKNDHLARMAAGEKEIIYHSNGEATTATIDHHSSDSSSAVPTFVPYETLGEQNVIAGLMKTKLWLRKNTPTWMHGLWRQVLLCRPASAPPPQPDPQPPQPTATTAAAAAAAVLTLSLSPTTFLSLTSRLTPPCPTPPSAVGGLPHVSVPAAHRIPP